MTKLNVTQTTFEKYLYSMGFNYKIKQYDDLISAIQRIVFNKLKNSEDLEKTISEIFIFIPSMSFLLKKENISAIKKEYLVSLIKDGYLDLFFNEKEEKFSYSQMKHAYFLYLINKQNSEETSSIYFELMKAKDLVSMKGKVCFNKNKIDLSSSQKEDISHIFYNSLFSVYFHSFTNKSGNVNRFLEDIESIRSFISYFYDLSDEETNILLTKHLSNREFIFEYKNIFQLHNTHKIFKIIDDLCKYYSYKSIVKVIKDMYITKSESYQYPITTMRTKLSKNRTGFSEKELREINETLMKLNAFDYKELGQLEFTFRNKQNEITLPLLELTIT